MKRILFLMTIMFCVGIVSAQDIISLRDGTLIENVSILSIGDEGVTYTKEGNTFSIDYNSVEAVLHADGQYEELKKTNIDTSGMMLPLVPDNFLICSAGSYYFYDWEKLVILQIIEKLHEKKKMSVLERQEYIYSLCIMKEDFKAYKKYLKEHKDINKLYKKACKQNSYDIAQIAAQAYREKKLAGVPSEEACATFVNGYINAYNQSKTNPK